ncbi:MerR family transcriptional regulator [Nocardia sp. NPDC003693]
MTTSTLLKIGDAAALLGMEAHVLRHWESVGLLRPPRDSAGHRGYDEPTLDVVRLIRRLQRTGLSLAQIRRLGLSGHDERVALIAAKRAEVREQIALLRATDRFLAHVGECGHPVIAECDECAAFVRADESGRHRT